jgi:pimeloyl-ACP methyl ester carboxylesterase
VTDSYRTDVVTVPNSSDYAKVNGLKMYYEVHGSGDGSRRPLVLLHGGVLTVGLSFAAVLPTLAAGRRVVAPELQGHGHTADTDRALTPANLASDVVALLDELGIERADVLGFSLGGLVALQLALAHPERVGRLASAPSGSWVRVPSSTTRSTRAANWWSTFPSALTRRTSTAWPQRCDDPAPTQAKNSTARGSRARASAAVWCGVWRVCLPP